MRRIIEVNPIKRRARLRRLVVAERRLESTTRFQNWLSKYLFWMMVALMVALLLMHS